MKTYFVFSDVHSFYDELIEALEEKGFDINNPDHIIISCGDLLDRGLKPLECLKFVNNLYKQNRAILIKGNHEGLLEEMLERGYAESHDEHNGTFDTCKWLYGVNKVDWESDYDLFEKVKKNKELKYYLHHLVNYAEIGNNIFVHGWLPLTADSDTDFYFGENLYIVKDWRDKPDGMGEEATWYNGMFQWHQGNKIEGKTIFCGHFHSSYGNARYHLDGVEFLRPIETYWVDPETGKTEPHVNYNAFKDDGIVALDACTILSHQVNCEVFNENNKS